MINYHGILIEGLEQAAEVTRRFADRGYVPGKHIQMNYNMATGELRWFATQLDGLAQLDDTEAWVCAGGVTAFSPVQIAGFVLAAVEEEAHNLLEHLLAEEELPRRCATARAVGVFARHFPATAGYLTYDRMAGLCQRIVKSGGVSDD